MDGCIPMGLGFWTDVPFFGAPPLFLCFGGGGEGGWCVLGVYVAGDIGDGRGRARRILDGVLVIWCDF